MQNLIIDGLNVKLDSTYSIRWVEKNDGSSYPTLYKNGRRIVKSWKIVMEHDEPEDPFGDNANTN